MGNSSVINEHKFSASYTSFWRTVIPLGDAFVRQMNVRLRRFADSLDFDAPSDRSALISETSFRLLVASGASRKALLTENIPDTPIVHQAASEAAEYLSRLRGAPSTYHDLEPDELAICFGLTQRLKHFFFIEEGTEKIIVRPRFEGCGFVESCEGDCLAGSILYEVKNVERNFRLVDVRQVLTYCALNYARQLHVIDGVGWINPRSGKFYRIGLEALAEATAGSSASELFSEVVDFLSRDPFSA